MNEWIVGVAFEDAMNNTSFYHNDLNNNTRSDSHYSNKDEYTHSSSAQDESPGSMDEQKR